MSKQNVRGTFLRDIWGFLRRSYGASVDSKLLPKEVREGAGRLQRFGEGAIRRKAKGDRHSGKNPVGVTSTARKGERGIGEICDQIHATADELIVCLKR